MPTPIIQSIIVVQKIVLDLQIWTYCPYRMNHKCDLEEINSSANPKLKQCGLSGFRF